MTEQPGVVRASQDGATEAISPRQRCVLGAVAVLFFVALSVLVLYARGGGPLPSWLSGLGPGAPDLLEESSPEEAALRTLRLAGYDHAVVGEQDGTVVVRLDIPEVRSPADAELSWQTAIAVGVGAFPRADEYVAQLFSDGIALLQVRVESDAALAAIDQDDGAALREAADFAYLSSSETGAGE